LIPSSTAAAAAFFKPPAAETCAPKYLFIEFLTHFPLNEQKSKGIIT